MPVFLMVFVVVVLAILAMWGISLIPVRFQPLNLILQLTVIFGAIYLIATKSGLF